MSCYDREKATTSGKIQQVTLVLNIVETQVKTNHEEPWPSVHASVHSCVCWELRIHAYVCQHARMESRKTDDDKPATYCFAMHNSRLAVHLLMRLQGGLILLEIVYRLCGPNFRTKNLRSMTSLVFSDPCTTDLDGLQSESALLGFSGKV